MNFRKFDLAMAILALAASPAMAKKTTGNSSSSEERKLPGECDELVRASVAYLDGGDSDEFKNAVKISHVQSVAGEPGPNPDHPHSYYKARVDGQSMKGTVKVAMTRGGCLLHAIDVSDEN